MPRRHRARRASGASRSCSPPIATEFHRAPAAVPRRGRRAAVRRHPRRSPTTWSPAAPGRRAPRRPLGVRHQRARRRRVDMTRASRGEIVPRMPFARTIDVHGNAVRRGRRTASATTASTSSPATRTPPRGCPTAAAAASRSRPRRARLSNAFLDTPWPKVVRVTAREGSCVVRRGLTPPGRCSRRSPTASGRRRRPADTGVTREWGTSSPPFIVGPAYGTRCSTIFCRSIATAVRGSSSAASPDGGQRRGRRRSR